MENSDDFKKGFEEGWKAGKIKGFIMALEEVTSLIMLYPNMTRDEILEANKKALYLIKETKNENSEKTH